MRLEAYAAADSARRRERCVRIEIEAINHVWQKLGADGGPYGDGHNNLTRECLKTLSLAALQ